MENTADCTVPKRRHLFFLVRSDGNRPWRQHAETKLRSAEEIPTGFRRFPLKLRYGYRQLNQPCFPSLLSVTEKSAHASVMEPPQREPGDSVRTTLNNLSEPCGSGKCRIEVHHRIC